MTTTTAISPTIAKAAAAARAAHRRCGGSLAACNSRAIKSAIREALGRDPRDAAEKDAIIREALRQQRLADDRAARRPAAAPVMLDLRLRLEQRRRQRARDERARRAMELVGAWLRFKGLGKQRDKLVRDIGLFVGGLLEERDLRRALARVQVRALAHMLAYRRQRAKRWTLDYVSASGSRYLCRGDVRLRLSDHHLGYADYGSREQVHRGPELVCTGDGSPRQMLRELVALLRSEEEVEEE